MRIAYLITAYADFEHLVRLVDALDEPDHGAGFYIHIDARSHPPDDIVARLAARPNVHFAPRRPIWWGGWSHTAAILSLMDMSNSAQYDYHVVLSGADYPIRSNEAIRAALAGGDEWINAAPGFRPGKPESRVRYYWFDGFDRRRMTSLRTLTGRAAEIALRTLGVRKRHYPFHEIFSGVVWSALSAPCVRWMLDYVRDNPRYVSFFRTAQVPEEMFFQSIIGNSPFAPRITHSPVWMDWDHPSASPPVVTREHLARLSPDAPKPTDRLFARKFTDASAPLLDTIDTWRKF